MLSKKNIGGANVERDRVLDEDEIKELAKKLPTANVAETASLAIWIVLATCCRIGELLKSALGSCRFRAQMLENSCSEQQEQQRTYCLSLFFCSESFYQA